MYYRYLLYKGATFIQEAQIFDNGVAIDPAVDGKRSRVELGLGVLLG